MGFEKPQKPHRPKVYDRVIAKLARMGLIGRSSIDEARTGQAIKFTELELTQTEETSSRTNLRQRLKILDTVLKLIGK